MVPESVMAMLACARIGATHNVVFGGFSGEALRDRLIDSNAKVLLTQDGAFRKGQPSSLKGAVDARLEEVKNLEHVLVLKRTGQDTPMKSGRDQWWHEVVPAQSTTCKAEGFDSEHPLFILYTSGSTGKPKGILHTTGGYLTQVKYTTKLVFDLKPSDIYFCSADIGWGHGSLVRNLRPTHEWCDGIPLRRSRDLSSGRSFLVDDCSSQNFYFLYGADCDSFVHEGGR